MTDNQTTNEAKERQTILNNIEKFGCHLVLIEADNYLPAFVYSIGLYERFKYPEIICFGLKTEVMASIINHACALIKAGQRLITNKNYSGFLQDFPIQFIKVDKEYYRDYLGYAGWFYNMSFDFPALQLVRTDKQNNFPWNEGFNSNWKFKQPLLDRNTDFKFYEERNLGVYTTKEGFNGEPILFAYHNEDGDWQFHTSDEPNLDDAMIVCLEEITKLDPTINELFRLQYGWRAWRDTQQDEWQFAEHVKEE